MYYNLIDFVDSAFRHNVLPYKPNHSVGYLESSGDTTISPRITGGLLTTSHSCNVADDCRIEISNARKHLVQRRPLSMSKSLEFGIFFSTDALAPGSRSAAEICQDAEKWVHTLK